jgi:cytochrome c553
MKNIAKISILSVVLMATATTVLAADAKANWEKHCAKCHGVDGKGQTKMGKQAGAKDYTDPKVQAEIKDDSAFKAIKEGLKVNGKEAMKPSSDKLSDDEIKALVAHVRTFGKK